MHFTYTQLCSFCKQSFKTFKIYLSFYDENFTCKLTKEEREVFSFNCCFCKNKTSINFDEITNPCTISYIILGEINNSIQEQMNNLLSIKIEKLNLKKKL